MNRKTLVALVTRGFDLQVATQLSKDGYTLTRLKAMDESALKSIGLPSEYIDIILRERRPPIPLAILGKILYESRMTCCVCRDRTQGIIVHHIREFSDSRSHDEENLVVLCLNHHGEAHTTRELQLNLTAERLIDLKQRWLADVRKHDIQEALKFKSVWSQDMQREIANAIQYLTSFKSEQSTLKFNLKSVEQESGRILRSLVEENTEVTVWELIQFPDNGYASQTLIYRDQLVISNFGSSSLSFYNLEEKHFSKMTLDSYEPEALGLVPERRGPDNPPTIRYFPPGDIMMVGDKLFVGQTFSEFVVVIDLATKQIVKRIGVGGEGKLAYCKKSGLVFFASNNLDHLAIINPKDYRFRIVSYPEARLRVGAISCHPETGMIYIGLHRTSKTDKVQRLGERLDVPNSFVAVYDPIREQFISKIDLVLEGDDKWERGWPCAMALAKKGHLLYVGMLGLSKNILVIDLHMNKVVKFIHTQPKIKNKRRGVDTLSLALHDNYLFAVNRANFELAIYDRNDLIHQLSLPLGGVNNGPSHISVSGNHAYISHSEYDGVIDIDLSAVIDMIPK
ncbi:hypothetical protein [Candidatus Leptofilum sp.]|uniref:hypothetical protein n=1 Tax=Candidatus Leptofilum sp. TaxID=3241576 RepID=UPI003B5913EC